MKITWWDNPDLDRDGSAERLKNFAESLGAEGDDPLPLITGRVTSGYTSFEASVQAIEEALREKADDFFVLPSSDCAYEASIRRVSMFMVDRSCSLDDKSPVIYVDTSGGKIAVIGQPGAEDLEGDVNLLNMPPRYNIKDYNRSLVKDRIEAMKRRAVNQTRILERKIRKAYRDREVHTQVIVLGTAPGADLWDRLSKDEAQHGPFFVSKVMRDFLEYRDTLKTRIPTIVLCTGGDTAKVVRHSETLTFIQAGGYFMTGGSIRSLHVQKNGKFEFDPRTPI